MSLPNTQALDSSTFSIPPLDDSISLPGLYDWHYERSPKHPLFVYEDEPGVLRTICYREAGQAMVRASQSLVKVIGRRIDNSEKGQPVIAILATSDTITFFCIIVGILRLGWVVFPISPRNSPPAVASLLTLTKAKHLLISADPAICNLAEESLKLIAGGLQPQKYDMPCFEDLFPTIGPDVGFNFEPMPAIDMDAPAMILHSSGTTAYPSPVTWTHRSWIRFARHPYYGGMDLTGVLLACHAVPMFHGMGVVQVNFAVSCGLVVSVFKPRAPATIPDPLNTLHGALITKSDIVAVVPAFIEAWSKNKQFVGSLAKMKGIVSQVPFNNYVFHPLTIVDFAKIFGGGPLNKEVGDYMVANGVKLFATYASTQLGMMSVFLPKSVGKDWEYFRFSPNREVHMIPDSHGASEAVIVATPEFTPRKINTKIAGRDAYATSDLFTPHPTITGLWTVFGRTDDQIMHSTGEKTNPGPLEAILGRDPHIQAAVMFGRAQFHAGVIVQPKEAFAFDPSDIQRVAAFRNLIWPSVQSANDYAPSHSRIFKEMILVATPEKPFSYTPKGTARRLAVISDYAPEIGALYKAAADSSQEDIEGPDDWDYSSVLMFVRVVVQRTLIHDDLISDEADLFNIGCDSLQATWIRNSILRVLRKAYPQVVRGLSPNFVFDNPSIKSISSYISSSVALYLRPSEDCPAATDEGALGAHEKKVAELTALVHKYTSELPVDPSNPFSDPEVAEDGAVVLLTGSTGSLGASILAHLLVSPTVKHTFALGRQQAGSSLYDRHVSSFERSGLDASLLLSSKITFIVGDLQAQDLGVDPVMLKSVKSSVTNIIHNAWRVDFKLSVSSMEPMIAGVRNLINLALSCASEERPTPKFAFISSVGVVQHATYTVPEVAFPSPILALGSGYSESKWVAERILDFVSRQTPLKSTVIRLGQMTGGPSGAWNETEWFPSLVKTSIRLKCLPDSPGEISWLHCENAAAALLELSKADHNAPTAYFHLVHPRPVTWSSMIRHFSDALQLEVIPLKDWFAKLEKMDNTLYSSHFSSDAVVEARAEMPALRLVDFFKAALNRILDPSTEPLGVPRLDCTEGLKFSRTLQDDKLPTMGADAINRWIQSWRSSGFI